MRADERSDPSPAERHRLRGADLEAAGDYAGALEAYEAAASAAHGEAAQECLAARHLAEIHIRLGDYPQAAEFADRALELGERLGDRRTVAEILNLVGRIHDYTGRTEQALEYYTRALEAHRAEGDSLGEATGLGNVGIIRMYRGEYDRAIESYGAALALDRARGDERRVTMMLSNLGEAHQFLGDFDEAIARHVEALEIARRIGFRMMEVEILRNIGIERVLRGETAEGLERLRESLASVETLGDMETLPQVLYSLADGLTRSGRAEEAMLLVDRLLDIALARGTKEFVAKGILLRSRAAPRRPWRAELERALAIAGEIGSRQLEAAVRFALAGQARTPEDARRHLDAARATVRAIAEQIADPVFRARFLESPDVAPILPPAGGL